LPAPDSLPEGNDAVEPVDVDGVEGAGLPGIGEPGTGDDVVPPGSEGAPVEGAGEGVDGTGESPVPGMGLPLESLEGLGTDGAPLPPELVLQPLTTSTAPMASAIINDARAGERLMPMSLSAGVFIGRFPACPLWAWPRRAARLQ
jgi:hypothetical protein